MKCKQCKGKLIDQTGDYLSCGEIFYLGYCRQCGLVHKVVQLDEEEIENQENQEDKVDRRFPKVQLYPTIGTKKPFDSYPLDNNNVPIIPEGDLIHLGGEKIMVKPGETVIIDMSDKYTKNKYKLPKTKKEDNIKGVEK